MPAHSPDLFQLLPHRPEFEPLTPAQLAELYAYPENQTTVRANMVSTIDGAAAGSNGLSGGINNQADFAVFQILRALAQVVLVGAGTARKEGYRHIKSPLALNDLRLASGNTEPLELALISRSGELPAQLLEQGPGLPQPLVFTTERGHTRLLHDHEHPRVVVMEKDGSVYLPGVVGHLADLGLGKVLTEGGPSLLAQLIDQGLLDELCLTTVGLLLPGNPLGITTSDVQTTPGPRGELAGLVYSDATLLARWKILANTHR